MNFSFQLWTHDFGTTIESNVLLGVHGIRRSQNINLLVQPRNLTAKSIKHPRQRLVIGHSALNVRHLELYIDTLAQSQLFHLVLEVAERTCLFRCVRHSSVRMLLFVVVTNWAFHFLKLETI